MSLSETSGMELLAVGDLHLGRRPSGLPPALAARGDELGPAAAWRRLVRRAIDHGIDAVLLAGDLVERDDDFFEAYRALAGGVRELHEAGIEVLGVAGNHDVRVLPRLADQIPEFRLLGRDGQWQRETLKYGGETVSVHGWSFPRQRVTASPLDGAGLERGPGLNLGLLHCDLDARDSRYAPVARAELEATGLDGWLLGHVHQPAALTAPSPLGYLGSVTGLHPGELGPRGPWRIRIEGGRMTALEQWRLAPLHWQTMDLNLEGLTAPDQAEDRLLEQLRDLDATLSRHDVAPDACGLRLRLTGSTDHAQTVRDQLLADPERNFAPGDGAFMFIERVRVATRPARSLEALAEGDHPAALLARRLLLLGRPHDDPGRRQLIERARERMEPIAAEARWQGLAPIDLDDGSVAAWLEDSATRLLETLLAQRAAPVRDGADSQPA